MRGKVNGREQETNGREQSNYGQKESSQITALKRSLHESVEASRWKQEVRKREGAEVQKRESVEARTR